MTTHGSGGPWRSGALYGLPAASTLMADAPVPSLLMLGLPSCRLRSTDGDESDRYEIRHKAIRLVRLAEMGNAIGFHLQAIRRRRGPLKGGHSANPECLEDRAVRNAAS
jgi:hypothetical protein